MNKPFIILFTIGSVFLMAFSIYKTAQAEAVIAKYESNTPPPPPVHASAISPEQAYAFFDKYHQSATPGNSKGILLNDGDPIVQFYVDQAQLIDPLKAKAAALGKDFIGLSAIPAFNDSLNSHTLIWVAVVDADASAGVRAELMLPDDNESWQDYIYDFVGTCPHWCPENSDMLWNGDWAE